MLGNGHARCREARDDIVASIGALLLGIVCENERGVSSLPVIARRMACAGIFRFISLWASQPPPGHRTALIDEEIARTDTGLVEDALATEELDIKVGVLVGDGLPTLSSGRRRGRGDCWVRWMWHSTGQEERQEAALSSRGRDSAGWSASS